ncbi:hydantoinase/oxoprolinase family protein [Natrarchaeobius chitinivorans]|nr:hydantoinase/oxoprolinase family protein [Natrarchaeobius chitinivorans]
MTTNVSIDIGGTFTDLYLVSDAETISTKVPTTEGDLSTGLMNVIESAAAAKGISVESLLDSTVRIVHGTTVATNAIIEDDTATTALICTNGFRDILWFREGGKQNPYDWDVDYPDPYVPRSLTFGVDERMTAEGTVRRDLDEDSVHEVVAEIERRDVSAVAVSLLWAQVNPEHERRIGEILDERLPEVEYSLSHQVNPVIREYRRTSSTAIDASIQSLVGDYLSKFQSILERRGYERSPLIVTANGGVMPVEEVIQVPIWTVDSGPTMLPVAANEYVQYTLDRANVIALDMGGTSFDVSVVSEGKVSRTRDATVGEDYALGIEKTEITSVGSGGGSIATVDDGNRIHVGPESAGAVPGPACYLRGGKRPTVTDAALVLGYLSEDHFLGGKMDISEAAAREAIDEHVAAPLGTDTVDAAQVIYSTTIQDVTNSIKDVTISNGIDPREYVIAGGGGALGMHVVPIAEAMGINDIILPPNAGVMSAVGGIVSDLVRDFSISAHTRSDEFDYDLVTDTLEELRRKSQRFFERNAIPDEKRSVNYYGEGRYPNQVWELHVQLPEDTITEDSVASIVDRFHALHEDTYGFSTDEPIEFLAWRAEARSRLETSSIRSRSENDVPDEPVPYETRTAYFEGEPYEVDAYEGPLLNVDHSISGPAIVDTSTTTIVVPPSSDLEPTQTGALHISR